MTDERQPRRSLRRQTRALALLAAFVATALPAHAQPAADQLVPKYGNDATPYPLYAGTFGPGIRWTDADLERIANHFDAFYGVPRFTRAQMDTLRRIKPTFQVINYKGNWKIRDHATYDREHRSGMLYYRVGTLRQPLSAADTTVHLDDMLGGLRASTADPDQASSGNDDGGFRQVIWLRIGDEYLRIAAVDGASATVVRGVAGSAPAAHGPDRRPGLARPDAGQGLTDARGRDPDRNIPPPTPVSRRPRPTGLAAHVPGETSRTPGGSAIGADTPGVCTARRTSSGSTRNEAFMGWRASAMSRSS